MANKDYTYDNIRDGVVVASFKQESGQDASASVKRLQTKLNRCGFDCGTPDGLFGSNTYSAVLLFQQQNALTVDGKAGKSTLKKLDALAPDSEVEYYGRELTHAELTGGYSTLSSIEALARTIYGEESVYTAGQAAVAREIYNRKNNLQYDFGDKCPPNTSRTWKDVVYSTPLQYAVMSSSNLDETINSRMPDQYSSSWANCVNLAKQLTNNICPSSTLGLRFFHRSASSSYPSNSYDQMQIPANVGNKFYNNATTRIS